VAGFLQGGALKKVAKEFPTPSFAIIDMVVDLPNVQSIVFKEQEGSLPRRHPRRDGLQVGKVGFVGGMDIPLIRKLRLRLRAGRQVASPMPKECGSPEHDRHDAGAAWNDPVKGGEMAKSQFDQGVDVIYHAAGGTGVGVSRQPPMPASSASASIPTRTTCIRARC
jgi:basic membrane protein A